MRNTTSVPTLVTAAVIAVVAWASTSTAYAIPAFARRYGTSCGTCHTVPPMLTPFGEAFRTNGYRFPGGVDDERTVDEPLELGQQANRASFPDEVWPGVLPKWLPLSLSLDSGLTVQRGSDDGGTPGAPIHAMFDAPTLGLIIGGAMGDLLSVFAVFEIDTDGQVALEQPHVIFTPLHDPAMLLLKVGGFTPSLTAFTVHHGIMEPGMDFTSTALGDNAWTLEPHQIGVEASGVAWHRLGWAVGVVEGAGTVVNPEKDFYGHIMGKIGGMSLDGYQPTGYSRAWQEMSLTAGASVYRGIGAFGDPSGMVMTTQTDPFWRATADLTAHIVNANVMVGGFVQHDDTPSFGVQSSGQMDGAIAEVSYVAFPWLVPVARYEYFRYALPGGTTTQNRFQLGISALVRPNVMVRLTGIGGSSTGNKADFLTGTLNLRVAF